MKSRNQDATGEPVTQSSDTAEKGGGLRTWLKRIGIAGFLFFLVKGLAWLFVLWGGARMLGCD